MACIVYTTTDTASRNVAESIKSQLNLEEAGLVDGRRHFSAKGFDILEVNESLLGASFLDSIKTNLLVLLHKHSSAEGVAAFTVHPEGNWTDVVKFGGKPEELSVASPANMLAALRALTEAGEQGVEVTYEATHHGPLLKTPSMFVELGGNSETMENKGLAEAVAGAVVNALSGSSSDYDRVALGIGGTHYPEKFTRLALEGKFAFAHMMPRYQIANVDMLEQAVERTDSKVEIAVIEWKSIKGADRERVLAKLEELGVDYERV